MPEHGPPDVQRPLRTDEDRAADHAAIDRLASGLLPSLIAKLGASGLGELEVREGGWRVRLRRPTDGRTSGPGLAAPSSRERGGRADRGDRDGHERPGRHPMPVEAPPDAHRRTAASPAVGVFRPRPDLSAGDRVRAGDALGAVDMLGVPQEVVAPADGIVASTLVESGEAVEYGQPLLLIELSRVSSPSGGAAGEALSGPSTNGTGGA